MKVARLAGLVLVAILAVGLTAASTASAEAHFRWQDIGLHFVGLSGLARLRGPGGSSPSYHCVKDLSLGTITSLDLVFINFIHFLECSSRSAGGTSCPAKSTNTSNSGLILLTTLHGLLGLILPRTGTGVGLLILPVNTETFVTLEGNACTIETSVTGSVAGEVSPVAQAVSLATVNFALTGGNQNIKAIDVLGRVVKPALTAFSATATEETEETIHWLNSLVEVT